MNENCEKSCIEQGTKEWLQLRKTKITATDAAIILNMNPWKTRRQLYDEKISDVNYSPMTPQMQRGIDLEPMARFEFTIMTGVHVNPAVFVKDWQMASVDGISEDGSLLVEIKCPGSTAHNLALQGKVPEYYYPQLQHQMHVCGLSKMVYFSYDGSNGALVFIDRDQEFIDKMNVAEKEFYECILSGNSPSLGENEYLMQESDDWFECANRYLRVRKAIAELEKEEEFIRNQLIFMCSNHNCKGFGVSACKMSVKGAINYSKIPELKDVDLEVYRKPAQDRWRIMIE